MRPRAILLALVVLLGAVTGLPPATAVAGHFSKPVRLPTKWAEWQFAVNNQGEAVGVHGSEAGAVVVQLDRSGRISHSWRVKAPAYTNWVDPSIALGAQGRIAVAFSYEDDQPQPGNEFPHGLGCCQHIAVASWKLGAAPPAAQSVAPPMSIPTGLSYEGYPPPLVAIAGSAVTALWARGFEKDQKPAEAQLEDAFGQVGKPLQTKKVLTVPHGFEYLDLHVEPNSRPVASWVEDRDTVGTVTGSSTGGLGTPIHFRHIPDEISESELTHQEQFVGFTHDDEGDTVFAYPFGRLGGPQKLMIMTSTYGGPFDRPREVTALPSETNEISLDAGGHRSLLALWTATGATAHVKARRGSVFGGFDNKIQLDATGLEDPRTTGFLDAQGRSVVIQRSPIAHHPFDFELDALTAQPNGPFGHPHPIVPGLRDCGLTLGEPIASNLEGQAVFYVTGVEESPQAGSQYLIRYTP